MEETGAVHVEVTYMVGDRVEFDVYHRALGESPPGSGWLKIVEVDADLKPVRATTYWNPVLVRSRPAEQEAPSET